MNTLPAGIYIENEKRFEFDFFTNLLKIRYFKESKEARSIVSPFRMIRKDEELFLMIHAYDRSGDRKIVIEYVDQDELVINHDNTSYKLRNIKSN